jgi:hypothetical protein
VIPPIVWLAEITAFWVVWAVHSTVEKITIVIAMIKKTSGSDIFAYLEKHL